MALAFVTLTACGTRLPNSAFVASQGGAAGQQAGAAGSGTGNDQALGGTANGSQPGSGGSLGTGSGSSGAGGSSTGSGTSGGGTGGTGTGAGGTGLAGTGSPTGGTKTAGSAANTASDVGVTADTITIGNVTSTSGAFGPEAFGVTQRGVVAYVNALNDRGGINGRKVNLVTCDDGSEGTHFLACVQKLVEQDHVFAFIGNNSDASASAANYEFTHGVPDVGFPLNNGYYKYPNMFSLYGANYPRDGKIVGYKNNVENQSAIYRYFRQNIHVTKAAVFYYVIPVSQQAGCFEENGLKEEGVPTVYEGGGGNGNCTGAGENPASPVFDEDVINMRSKGVDTVFDAMDVSANERLCTSMDRQGFQVKAKVSTIEVYSQRVGTEWSAPCRNNVYIGGSSTTFADTANPAVARFRTEFAKYQPSAVLHQWSLEGWALGYEFEDIVKSMGANVTRKGFIDWLNKIPGPPGTGGYTYGGLFTPTTYVPWNFAVATPNCQTIAQWQDSAKSYVQREGTNYCPVTPWVATPATNDGA